MSIDLTQLPALGQLEELVDDLVALRSLPPLERARAVRDLAGTMRAALGHVSDEAIAQALTESYPRRTYQEVAAALEVSTSRINKSTTRYRAFLTSGAGRKPEPPQVVIDVRRRDGEEAWFVTCLRCDWVMSAPLTPDGHDVIAKAGLEHSC